MTDCVATVPSLSSTVFKPTRKKGDNETTTMSGGTAGMLLIALAALGLSMGYRQATWQRRLTSTRRISFLEASLDGKDNYELTEILQEDSRNIPVSDGRREILNALNSVSGGFSGGGYGFLPFEQVVTRPVGLFDVVNDAVNASPKEITNKIKGYFAGIRLRSSSPDTLQQFKKYLQANRDKLDVVNALLLVKNHHLTSSNPTTPILFSTATNLISTVPSPHPYVNSSLLC